MKGARGLLISITGGHDLTLYEVDEAASRIRQEVDEDANIILGATFDSSLEGVIRVSVVATGIDLAAITVDDPTSQARMAEAAERMRAQMQSQAKPLPAPAPAPEASTAQIYTMPERAPAPAYQPEIRESAPAPASYYPESIPTAPAQMTTNGVYLEPVAARQTYAEPMPEPAPRMIAEPASGPYVPPAPEMPRVPRMPSIEDFPKPVQDQLRQQRVDAAHDPRRKSIFERLASFGASRQEDAIQGGAAPAPMPPRAPQPSPAHAEYGKRPVAAPAPQQAPAHAPHAAHAPRAPHAALDPHGRRAPQPRPVEEDHLEIPAFLRRQSNH
jgi:cell division protein FtsZ